MTITLDFQSWLDFIVNLPLWIKIVAPITFYIVVALIIHRWNGPYENNDEHISSMFDSLIWPLCLFLLIIAIPSLLFYFLGGKIEKKDK